MSENTEMMLDGTLCSVCGVFVGSGGDGFPRTCRDCRKSRRVRRKQGKPKKRKFVDLGECQMKDVDRAVFLTNGVESGYPLVAWREFRFGTVGGQWREVDDAIEILALENTKPGNGDFQAAIHAIEQKASSRCLLIRVRHFTNKRLKEWFLRRDYDAGVSEADGTDFVQRRWM